MYKLLRSCTHCHTYTLERECPKCMGKTISPHPPKFSPDDKYARLRLRDRYVKDYGEDSLASSTGTTS